MCMLVFKKTCLECLRIMFIRVFVLDFLDVFLQKRTKSSSEFGTSS